MPFFAQGLPGRCLGRSETRRDEVVCVVYACVLDIETDDCAPRYRYFSPSSEPTLYEVSEDNSTFSERKAKPM